MCEFKKEATMAKTKEDVVETEMSRIVMILRFYPSSELSS